MCLSLTTLFLLILLFLSVYYLPSLWVNRSEECKINISVWQVRWCLKFQSFGTSTSRFTSKLDYQFQFQQREPETKDPSSPKVQSDDLIHTFSVWQPVSSLDFCFSLSWNTGWGSFGAMHWKPCTCLEVLWFYFDVVVISLDYWC